MLGSNRDTKTIRIPVVFGDGEITLPGRLPLPKIRAGSTGELVLSEWAVEDADFVKEYQSQATILMLDAGQSIFFTVHVHQMPSELWREAEQKKQFEDGPEGPCVQVRLDETLKLRLRGSKTPALCGCKCIVPCLGNKEAVSLNHAYTLISTYFETKRISHAGNVFQLGWSWDEGRKQWIRLDDLRSARQAEHEAEDR